MKRIHAVPLLLSAALLLGLALPTMGSERIALPDVPEDHWARPVIEEWYSYGVLAGDTDTGRIRPDDSLSRAELGVLLDRIMGYPLIELKHFNDVPADAWYAETMSRLNSAGIIQGDGNNMVRPQDPVTRQETAVILCRALGIPEEEADVDFLDKEEIAPWAAGAVGALYNMGAIHGWEGYFDPQDPIARSHVVTLLDNLIGAVMTRPGTWDRDVEGDLYICNKQALLENFTVTGDLILSHGVDTGNVTLDHVTVKGNLIIHGGGEHSIHIQSGCVFEGDILLDKTVAGSLRLVNEAEEPLKPIRIQNVSPELILEGAFTGLDLHCGARAILRKGKAETLSVRSPQAEVVVEKDSQVAALTVEPEAKADKTQKDVLVSLTVEGEVTSFTSCAPARLEVDKSGKVPLAHAAASGLILAGDKRPDKITVASGASRPKDETGKTISNVEYTGGSSGGGSWGGGGGGSSTPSYKGDINLSLTAPSFGKTPGNAQKASGESGYTIVKTEWQNGDGTPATYRYDSNTFTANHSYRAVITLTLTPDPTPTPPPSEPPVAPTTEPSVEPSTEPSVEPSPEPSTEPSVEPTQEPAPAARTAQPPAARASDLYFGKPLSSVTVSLNGKRLTNIVRDEEAHTLTCTYVFPATEKKDLVEGLSITLASQELSEGDQVSASAAFTKDNQLADPSSYEYRWKLDGEALEATGASCTFPALRGSHSLTCELSAQGQTPVTAPAVSFTVKGEPEESQPPVTTPPDPEVSPSPDPEPSPEPEPTPEPELTPDVEGSDPQQP